ncbi:F-box protein At5g41720-like [Lycium ferocissimum]|uniref:F-box protein At5g41720-like n=1 Tax=Lycium ferocissimum TaxID=112874 RepID=UPI00281656E3|nr:F-box protein At5g41720-like [Lycium ferocissimum]
MNPPMPLTSSELPHDVAFKILTRTSLETLDACKVVSKTWNGMTYESSFMESYCCRTNNISGYFVQGIRNNKYISEFVSMDGCSEKDQLSHLPVAALKTKDIFSDHYNCDMKIEASSKQGILCCMRTTRNDNHRYYICKPSTQEWKKLPNPKMRYKTVKVALVVLKSNPLRFKIIRLSQDDPARSSGLIYLLTTDNQVLVLNYDGEEAYPRFELPEQVTQNEDCKYKKLISYEGKLRLICFSWSEILELWCIENTRNPFWTKEKEVEIESIKRVTNYPSPIDFYNNEIVLLGL